MICNERFFNEELISLNKIIKLHYKYYHPEAVSDPSKAVMKNGARRGRGVAIQGRKKGKAPGAINPRSQLKGESEM